MDCGGENRVQELVEKRALGAYEGRPLHFIGHLQTNKVKFVVGAVDLIESVDREELLACVDRQARKLGIVQDILLEVNIGLEQSKSGFTAEQVELERLLHLKTGCTYLEDGRLLAAGEMWERPLYRESGRFSEIFHVPDAEAYAADAVRINDCVIMSAGYPSVRAQIGAWGYRVIELEMSEFRKIDGSITCLSLRW